MRNKMWIAGLAGLTLVAMAGCASKPKPASTVASTIPAQPPSTPYSPPVATQAYTPPTAAPIGPAAGSEEDFVLNVGDRIYFDFDAYSLRSDALPILDAQAAWLNRYPGVPVRIEGNCDERGTREYNLALGARRANVMADYLVSKGVSSARIATLSYGKERPLDTNSNEDGWARNRNGRTALAGGANQ